MWGVIKRQMATVRESQRKREMTYTLGDGQRRTLASALLMKAVCQQGGFSKVPSSPLLPATTVKGGKLQSSLPLTAMLLTFLQKESYAMFVHACRCFQMQSIPAHTLATIGCNCAHMEVNPPFTWLPSQWMSVY
jgi:hypothetical protein